MLEEDGRSDQSSLVINQLRDRGGSGGKLGSHKPLAGTSSDGCEAYADKSTTEQPSRSNCTMLLSVLKIIVN